jgi:hypothetical protein
MLLVKTTSVQLLPRANLNSQANLLNNDINKHFVKYKIRFIVH